MIQLMEFLRSLRAQQPALIALIKEMAECESPSDNPAAVNRFVDLLGDKLHGVARVKTYPGGKFGRHLRAEETGPDQRRRRRSIALSPAWWQGLDDFAETDKWRG